jgi:hypothetical protein
MLRNSLSVALSTTFIYEFQSVCKIKDRRWSRRGAGVASVAGVAGVV